MSRSSRTLYVGNIPREICEGEVAAIFYKPGRIAHIDLKTPPGHPSYAFVEFEEARDAEDAMNDHNGYKFRGNRLRVEFAHGGRRSSVVDHYSGYMRGGGGGHGGVSRRSEYQVSVTGLPSSASWQDLKDHMRRAGDVCFSQVFRDASGTTGIVDYTSYDDMKYAVREYKSSQSWRRSRSYSRSRSRSPADSKGRSYSGSRSWRYMNGVLEKIEEIGWGKFLDEEKWKAASPKGPVEFTVLQLKEFTGDFNHYVETGGFGNVYKGHMMGRVIAVKRSHPVDSYFAYFSWMREVTMLRQLRRHRNTIELLGYKCCEEKKELFLVYPFYSNGSLRDALAKPDEVNELGWSQVIKIIKGIVRGLEYLHSAVIIEQQDKATIKSYEGLIHCDLKPDNVLLDEHLEPVICDFGNSTPVGLAHTGTPYYHDDATARAEPRSDLYSLGIVILQLLGRQVNPGGLRARAVEAVTKHLLLHPRLAHSQELRTAGAQLIELALLCSDINPHNRPDSVADFIVEFDSIIDGIGDGRRSLVLVVFIGGVTSAEISALRFLSAQEGMAYELIVGTTKIISGHTLTVTFIQKLG